MKVSRWRPRRRRDPDKVKALVSAGIDSGKAPKSDGVRLTIARLASLPCASGRGRLPKGGRDMSNVSTQRDTPDEDAAKSNFEIYRAGGTRPDIRLTINLVLVARRWRSLMDDRLRLVGQSSARMEALAA